MLYLDWFTFIDIDIYYAVVFPLWHLFQLLSNLAPSKFKKKNLFCMFTAEESLIFPGFYLPKSLLRVGLIILGTY